MASGVEQSAGEVMYQPRVPITGFDWTEFLNLARQIAGNMGLSVSQEARLRSAISRAYYAEYHRASRLAFPDRGPRGFGSHSEVRDFFLTSDDPTQRGLGVKLQRLHGNRRKADYQSTISGDLSRMTEDSLNDAEELIAAFGDPT